MVGTGTISFPGLGIYDIDIPKVAFTLFGIEFRWYGVLIGIAFALALIVAVWLCKKAGENVDHLLDIVIFATPVAIIGARTYYVLQTLRLGYYDSVWDYFKVWEGGLAIYGGVIGAVLTAAIYCKIKKISLAGMLDLVGAPFLLAQAIGRWGNFINQEAFGTATDLPWRMELLIGGSKVCVHPTFLYESLWNLIGFVVLMLLFRRRKWKGEIFTAYLGWYGFGRFFIEGLRTDSLMLTDGIRTSQWLSAILFVGAVILSVVMHVRVRRQREAGQDYTPVFAEAAAAVQEEGASAPEMTIVTEVVGEDAASPAGQTQETQKEEDDNAGSAH